MPTIMIVDDFEPNRFLLDMLMQRSGYQTLVASNGVEALELLDEQQPPHLILLDLAMPRMDGWEVSQHIKGNSVWSHIPIIALTANLNPMELDRVMGNEWAGYIGKPFEIQDLLQKVQQTLETYHYAAR